MEQLKKEAAKNKAMLKEWEKTSSSLNKILKQSQDLRESVSVLLTGNKVKLCDSPRKMKKELPVAIAETQQQQVVNP